MKIIDRPLFKLIPIEATLLSVFHRPPERFANVLRAFLRSTVRSRTLLDRRCSSLICLSNCDCKDTKVILDESLS